TIIADDQPVIRPKCAAQTIFLSVRPDDQLRVLTNTALVENEFSASAEQRPLEWRLLSDKTESIKFRYRRADSEFAKELIHLFKDTLGFDEMKLATAGAVPVIADMENLTIKSDHDNTDDPLASVVSIRVWIRFATPEVVPFLAEADNIPCPTVASPVPDLDCDGDVDELDLNIVLNNRNKSVSQSTCGITSCGTTCDLDRDEKITALDARKLILLCSRPRCATQ